MTILNEVINPTNSYPVTKTDKINREAPDFVGILNQMKQQTKMEINCAIPGKIQTFYSADQTADVTVLMRKSVNNIIYDYPALLKLPVFFPGGGLGRLTFPVNSNDECVILFCDRSIDQWFTSGGSFVPDSERLHDISDGVAFVGFRSLGTSLNSFFTGGVELAHGDSKIRMVDGDYVEMLRSNSFAKCNGVASSIGVTGGAVVKTESKVHVASQAMSLLAVLNSLVQALVSWTGTDPQGGVVSPTPATVSALNAVQVSIGQVLE